MEIVLKQAPHSRRRVWASPLVRCCRTCGLPEIWHKTLANGDTTLNAETRARVGDTFPDVCWKGDFRLADYDVPRAPWYKAQKVKEPATVHIAKPRIRQVA